jgi:hypothetical protein
MAAPVPSPPPGSTSVRSLLPACLSRRRSAGYRCFSPRLPALSPRCLPPDLESPPGARRGLAAGEGMHGRSSNFGIAEHLSPPIFIRRSRYRDRRCRDLGAVRGSRRLGAVFFFARRWDQRAPVCKSGLSERGQDVFPGLRHGDGDEMAGSRAEYGLWIAYPLVSTHCRTSQPGAGLLSLQAAPHTHGNGFSGGK